MSAPLSAYHSKALKDKTTPQNYLMCKFLPEYTNIKKEFYLDAILRYKDGVVYYFGGACLVGSENSKHHANSRKGKIFDELEVYTDGGLNTLAYTEFRNLNEPTFVNWTNIKYFLKSAYYNDTTSFGYSYKINSGSWVDVSLGSLSQKLSKEELVRHINFTPDATKADTIYMRVWATNSEGTKYSDNYTFTAGDLIQFPLVNANKLTAIDSNENTTVTLYLLQSDFNDISDVTTTDSDTGIMLYASEYFKSSNYIADGIYLISGKSDVTGDNSKEKVFTVLSGQIRKYTVRDKIIPKILFKVVSTKSGDLWRHNPAAEVTNNGTFALTVSTSVEVTFYNSSQEPIGETQTKTINLVAGESSATGSLLFNLPTGSVYASVICLDNQATLGMPKIEGGLFILGSDL